MVKVDEMHYTNVIFNLLDNAVKYRREDVPLNLGVKTRDIKGKYDQIKKKIHLSTALKDTFEKQPYINDYHSNLRSKPNRSIRSYQNKVKELRNENLINCSKNLTHFKNKKTVCIGLEGVLMDISTMLETCDVRVPIYLNDDFCISEIGRAHV